MQKNEIDIQEAYVFHCRDCVFFRDDVVISRCALQNPVGSFLEKTDFVCTRDDVERWRLADGSRILQGCNDEQILTHIVDIVECRDKRYRMVPPEMFGGPEDQDD